MKVKYGDLLEAASNREVDLIIHQCNCFCNMGAGIAPLIAKKYPGALEVDKKTVRGDESKMGTYTHHVCPETGVVVVNMYSQYGWWRRKDGQINTDYEAMRIALNKIKSELIGDNKELRVGIPKIGCGLGGGSWEVVSSIFEEVMGDCDVTLYLVD